MKNHQDRIGQQMGGYRLLRLLGCGNFGAVYLAQSTPQQEPVALKLLQTPLSSSEEFKSFLNEARTFRLQHPHIVPLLDFGTSREDLPYLVMEYVPGGTLRERYPRGTRLPLAVVCHYISQLASALHYAHQQRVIHRDVKPENMLLRADGMVLLSDFGIARVVEQSIATNLENAAGTPAYIAPEQSYGKPQPASDQYALAVVAYEWLAGSRPFAGTPLEIVVQHRLDAPPSLRALRQDLPIEAEQVIARALAKRPEERFATIEQFALALNATSQPASKANTPLLSAALMPSALMAPSLALPQRIAVRSQAETPPIPGREPAAFPPPHRSPRMESHPAVFSQRTYDDHPYPCQERTNTATGTLVVCSAKAKDGTGCTRAADDSEQSLCLLLFDCTCGSASEGAASYSKRVNPSSHSECDGNRTDQAKSYNPGTDGNRTN